MSVINDVEINVNYVEQRKKLNEKAKQKSKQKSRKGKTKIFVKDKLEITDVFAR